MCRLQTLIKQKFTGAKLLNYQSPEEIVALGCAKQCSIIKSSKNKKPIEKADLLFKCLSSSIYINVLLSSGNNFLLHMSNKAKLKLFYLDG
jgi:molecular chaperone DnaK (HSP70)